MLGPSLINVAIAIGIGTMPGTSRVVRSAVLATTGRLDGNSGAVNFLNEGGIGYKFKRDWHVAAKINHVSNLGFASKNSGANSLGIAMGYTF